MYVTQHPLHMWCLLYIVLCVCVCVFALQDFSDLDGVVQQRRQEMMESSSSGSQTPDYDKMNGMKSSGTILVLHSSGPAVPDEEAWA